MLKKILNPLIALLNGLVTVFIHLFRKTVTLEYPEIKIKLNTNFRGKHTLNNCVGCRICQKVCPANAISINKNANIIESYFIDYSKCIFCGNCIYNCPTKSIKLSDEFELATPNKLNLVVNLIKVEELYSDGN